MRTGMRKPPENTLNNRGVILPLARRVARGHSFPTPFSHPARSAKCGQTRYLSVRASLYLEVEFQPASRERERPEEAFLRSLTLPARQRAQRMNAHYLLTDTSAVFSPGLLFYKDLIRRNLARALEMAGGPARLRPHVKTHKTREIVRLELNAGITKHKCATLAEAEM